jgi:hypothetical protein
VKVGNLVKPKPHISEGKGAIFREDHPQNYIGLVINIDHDPTAPGCVVVFNPKGGSFHQWHTSRLGLIV